MIGKFTIRIKSRGIQNGPRQMIFRSLDIFCEIEMEEFERKHKIYFDVGLMSSDPDIFRRAKNKYFRIGVKIIMNSGEYFDLTGIQEGIEKIFKLRQEYEDLSWMI